VRGHLPLAFDHHPIQSARQQFGHRPDHCSRAFFPRVVFRQPVAIGHSSYQLSAISFQHSNLI